MMSYMTLSMQTGRKIHFMGMNGSMERGGLFCDDTAYGGWEDTDAINWSHMYIMDINNDGKDEIFTKTPPGYRQPFEHSIKWYHKDFKAVSGSSGGMEGQSLQAGCVV